LENLSRRRDPDLARDGDRHYFRAGTSSAALQGHSQCENPENPGMTAFYIERYLNFGLTPGELRSGKPIIGTD
jgi:hypothetical protein